MKTDNSGKIDETYNRLDNIISSAIAKALTENGIDFDTGMAGEFYIDDEKSQRTFYIESLKEADEYMGEH